MEDSRRRARLLQKYIVLDVQELALHRRTLK